MLMLKNSLHSFEAAGLENAKLLCSVAAPTAQHRGKFNKLKLVFPTGTYSKVPIIRTVRRARSAVHSYVQPNNTHANFLAFMPRKKQCEPPQFRSYRG